MMPDKQLVSIWEVVEVPRVPGDWKRIHGRYPSKRMALRRWAKLRPTTPNITLQHTEIRASQLRDFLGNWPSFIAWQVMVWVDTRTKRGAIRNE